MNRNELATSIAERAGLTEEQAQEALAAALDSIADTVAGGGRVTLAGFGIFEPRDRAARTGRNPQTGAEIQIAASVAPAFKPSSAFRQRVAAG